MVQRVTIIDYGSGNLRSVQKAVELAAREAGMASRVYVADDPDLITAADRQILPGVGAYAACMAGLSKRTGVLEAMQHVVLAEGRPFLGICVGMQLLADQGFEFEVSPGLGWITGAVRPLSDIAPALRVPHMGWNAATAKDDHDLFQGLEGQAFYFANSFYFDPQNVAHVLCESTYGQTFASGIVRDNIAGVQFHPEKSQTAGQRFLTNFLHWTP